MAVRVKVELNEKDRNEVEDVLQQLLANSEKNVQEEVQCVLQDQQSDLVQEKISNENDHNERMSPVVNGGSNEETTMIIGELQQDQQSEMPEEQRAKAPVNDKDDMHVTEVESVPILQNRVVFILTTTYLQIIIIYIIIMYCMLSLMLLLLCIVLL